MLLRVLVINVDCSRGIVLLHSDFFHMTLSQ